MNEDPLRNAPSVADLVARFDKPVATTAPSAALKTSPWRLPSGRVKQLAGAYEAQLRALIKQLEEERARRQRRRASSSSAACSEEDAALDAALQDVHRLLQAHCATHATPHTTRVDDTSEGPGTPDPMDEPTPEAHTLAIPDTSLQATEQRVQDLLQRMHDGQGGAWWGRPRALELQPTTFDPLTANSMYADPLRQAAYPLVPSDDE